MKAVEFVLLIIVFTDKETSQSGRVEVKRNKEGAEDIF